MTKRASSNLIFIVIGFVLCWFIMKGCETTTIKTEYKNRVVYIPKIDTVQQKKTVKEYYKDTVLSTTVIHDTVIEEIITEITPEELAKIAKLYYDINVYNDTISVDSIGFISIKDSLQRNNVIHREVGYSLEIPVAEDNRVGFLSVHSMVSLINEDFDIAVGSSYTTKTRWRFGYSYGIRNQSHNITIGKNIWNK